MSKQQNLIDKYNKLKSKIIPRWDKLIKNDERIITKELVNKYMSDEIEMLRSHISQLKVAATRAINSKGENLE